MFRLPVVVDDVHDLLLQVLAEDIKSHLGTSNLRNLGFNHEHYTFWLQMRRVELEVDQEAGSTYLLETDQTARYTYL